MTDKRRTGDLIMAADKPKPYTPLLTCEEVADFLGLKLCTVWEMARAGTIPCYKVGRVYRFKLDRVERWLAGKEQKCRIPAGPILG